MEFPHVGQMFVVMSPSEVTGTCDMKVILN